MRDVDDGAPLWQEDKYPVETVLTWFRAGVPDFPIETAEQYRRPLIRACNGYVARANWRGTNGGVGREDVWKVIRQMAGAALSMSEAMETVLKEGGRVGQGATDRGRAARTLWQVIGQSFIFDILTGAPLTEEQRGEIMKKQAGGWKVSDDGLDYPGLDKGLPISLRRWSARISRVADGEDHRALFDALAPIGRSGDALQGKWMQEIGAVWEQATGLRPTSNSPRDPQPTTWRSPFHRFAQAAWDHVGCLLSADLGDVGSPDTVRRLLTPA
jgi:hypothetical protein